MTSMAFSKPLSSFCARARTASDSIARTFFATSRIFMIPVPVRASVDLATEPARRDAVSVCLVLNVVQLSLLAGEPSPGLFYSGLQLLGLLAALKVLFFFALESCFC